MQFDNFSFGSIQIDGSTYEYDVVIDRGEISKRKKKASKQFREEFGHTPLSVEENIPWKCRQLVIGSGAYGRLPLMQEVRRKAKRLKIKLLVLPTAEAVKVLEALVTTMVWTFMLLNIGSTRLNSRWRTSGSPPTRERCKGRCCWTRRTMPSTNSLPR